MSRSIDAAAAIEASGYFIERAVRGWVKAPDAQEVTDLHHWCAPFRPDRLRAMLGWAFAKMNRLATLT